MPQCALRPAKSRSAPDMLSTQSKHHSRGPFLNAPSSLCSLARTSTSILSQSPCGQLSPVPVVWGSRSRPKLVTCADGRSPGAGRDHGRVVPLPVPDLRPAPRLADLLGRASSSKDVELHVLRHEVAVLPQNQPPSPVWTGPTAHYSPPSSGGYRQRCGATAWSPRARSCAGTAVSYGGHGPTRTGPAAHRSTPPSPRSSLGWRGTTRSGATAGSRANCSSSATASALRRSAGFSNATGSRQRRRGTPTPAGAGSCTDAATMLAVNFFHVGCAVTLRRLYVLFVLLAIATCTFWA
jgi:hypothetical protein